MNSSASVPGSSAGVRAEYERRLTARRQELEELSRRERRLGDLRLLTIGAGLLLAVAALGFGWLSPLVLLVPVAVFIGLVLVHEGVRSHTHRAQASVRFYEAGMQRLNGEWRGKGVSGDAYRDPLHPYSADLDIFGSGSLFELLCTARTPMGEAKLAEWLSGPADAATVRARQEAVADLRARPDLREELEVLGTALRSRVDVGALTAWAKSPAALPLPGTGLRVAGALFSLAALGAVGVWVAGYGPLPLIGIVAVQQLWVQRWAAEVGRAVRSVDQADRDLALFSRVLRLLEAERFESPLLRSLREGLEAGGAPPSARLARLERLVGMLQAQQNGVFALLGILLLWRFQYAFLIEEWRVENGPLLPRWLEIAAECEALCALATYAYEHPEHPFPEVLDDAALFEGDSLAHPLLPEEGAVPNDVRIGGDLRLLLVSGSNMSGKSTLMRTVGTNTVLALAGAPVRAARLRVGVMNIGASIIVQDSLHSGVSRFYAEITRLRQIVELTDRERPLLFLLDEILHGTNSHDRRIGAEAVVRALVRKGAVGIVTTHDLALARIAEDAEVGAANVHLEDHLEDGKMAFDYQLRPGVVQKSNALALMRAVGLEV
ncbi:MAG: MutS-related protein [Armatimonadota bacterium]